MARPSRLFAAYNIARWKWDRVPFGTTLPNENPNGLGVFTYNLRLPGQFYDSETGLNYNYFRDYDPAIGRYVESDPIGLSGGINTYAYVSNYPVLLVDELGLAACKCTSSGKDYDASQGYYIDKFGWTPLPTISGRFACMYTCTAEGGNPERILGYVHSESYLGFSGGGPTAAKKFICKKSIAEFIPRYASALDQTTGNVSYYETVPYGEFDPRGSGISGLESWAKKNCTCEK